VEDPAPALLAAKLAAAFPGGLEPSAVAEVVAYLLAVGRAVLDDEGYLVRQR
jgi:hypothetical protein